MVLQAPQLTYLAIVFLGLGMVATKHGERRTGKHSFWETLFGTAIQMGIMYWGGFFG